MTREELQLLTAKIEAILFVSNDPVSAEVLSELLKVGPTYIKKGIQELMTACNNSSRGIELVAVSGGFQFRTKSEHAEFIREHLKSPPLALSPKALEVLAIIAYKQPISRAEIEQIRRGHSFYLISELLEAGFIEVYGKSEFEFAHLYRATTKFLKTFGLEDFSSLPALPEVESGDPVDPNDDLNQLKSDLNKLFNSVPELSVEALQEEEDRKFLEQITLQINGIKTTTPFLEQLTKDVI